MHGLYDKRRFLRHHLRWQKQAHHCSPGQYSEGVSHCFTHVSTVALFGKLTAAPSFTTAR
jgi:hypothetical protein